MEAICSTETSVMLEPYMKGHILWHSMCNCTNMCPKKSDRAVAEALCYEPEGREFET
jgi:hypothetical protein